MGHRKFVMHAVIGLIIMLRMYSDVFYSAAIMISMLLSTLYWCLEAFIRRLMQQ